MVKYFVFDTETTGLNPEENRIIEIAWIIIDDNKIIKQENFLIKNDGFKIIPNDATKKNNITQEMIEKDGISWNLIIISLKNDIKEIDLIIGHNVDFDIKFLISEFKRGNNKDLEDLIKSKKTYCTMERGTEIYNDGGKWIRLEDLHNKIFFNKRKESHRALDDSIMTWECFSKLIEKEKINNCKCSIHHKTIYATEIIKCLFENNIIKYFENMEIKIIKNFSIEILSLDIFRYYILTIILLYKYTKTQKFPLSFNFLENRTDETVNEMNLLSEEFMKLTNKEKIINIFKVSILIKSYYMNNNYYQLQEKMEQEILEETIDVLFIAKCVYLLNVEFNDLEIEFPIGKDYYINCPKCSETIDIFIDKILKIHELIH